LKNENIILFKVPTFDMTSRDKPVSYVPRIYRMVRASIIDAEYPWLTIIYRYFNQIFFGTFACQ